MKNKLVRFFLATFGLAALFAGIYSTNVYAADVCQCETKDTAQGYRQECKYSETKGECSASDVGKTKEEVENNAGGSGSGTTNRPIGEITSDKDINAHCYDSKIEGVAWILCPTISNSTKSIDAMSGLIDSMLSIDTDWYNGDSAAHTVWQNILTIANISMIIVLLVVIFSQVTGVGIDNYGIKKILPRLIVMAILINLSYLICQIAVDLSNILGVSLNGLFSSVADTSNLTDGKIGVVEKIVTALFVLASSAGSIVGIGGTGLAILSGGGAIMLVIFLVLLLLVALAAVALFFLALGMRTMLVVVLIAIAPLAFAAYILPNTQQLFKKWWNAFKAVLLVYPICGALMGISKVIQVLALNNNNDAQHQFWIGMIAVVAPFLPFFLLPSLLKGAISAVGMIGNAAVGLGTKWRSGVGNSAKVAQEKLGVNKAAEAGRMKMDYDRAVRKHAELSGIATQRNLNALEHQQLVAAQGTLDKQTKLWEAEFSTQAPDHNAVQLAEAMKSGDVQKATAAYNALHSAKKFDTIMDTFAKSNIRWDSSVGQAMKGLAMSSSERPLKLFGSKTIGTPTSFQEYMSSGALSSAAALQKGLASQDKGTIEYLASHQPTATLDSGTRSAMMDAALSGMINAQSGEDRLAYKRLLGSSYGQFTQGEDNKTGSQDRVAFDSSSRAEFLQSLSNKVNGSMLTKMKIGDVETLNRYLGDDTSAVSALQNAWNQVLRDGSGRLKANMDPELVKELTDRLGDKISSVSNSSSTVNSQSTPSSNPTTNTSGILLPGDPEYNRAKDQYFGPNNNNGDGFNGGMGINH